MFDCFVFTSYCGGWMIVFVVSLGCLLLFAEFCLECIWLFGLVVWVCFGYLLCLGLLFACWFVDALLVSLV